MHETNAAFVLEGELLGLENKPHVNIEFMDDNALLIKGRIERKVHSARLVMLRWGRIKRIRSERIRGSRW